MKWKRVCRISGSLEFANNQIEEYKYYCEMVQILEGAHLNLMDTLKSGMDQQLLELELQRTPRKSSLPLSRLLPPRPCSREPGEN
jgi:hypothetical protein